MHSINKASIMKKQEFKEEDVSSWSLFKVIGDAKPSKNVLGLSIPTVNNNDYVEDNSGQINMVFLNFMELAFMIVIIALIVLAGYVSYCQGIDEEEYDNEIRSNTRTLLKNSGSALLVENTFLSAEQVDNDLGLTEIERLELPKMSSFEVELYQRSKEFRKICPPVLKEFGTYMNAQDHQLVKDRGIQAYYFLPSINDNVDRRGNFLPSFLVQDKLNLTFTKHNKSSSSMLNFPLPNNRKDAVYFEVKVYKFKNYLKSNSIFSVGLVTCPYPYFNMPGRSSYSIAYESTGKLRINNAFYANTLLPKLQEGDVVGIGYRYRSGSIFITHNGRKLMDLTQNIGFELFIGVGAMNAAYTRTYTKDGLVEDIDNVDLRKEFAEIEKNPRRNITEVINELLLTVHDPMTEQIDSDEIELHVNLGNIGYVFVEANVKKYSFGSLYGDIGIPPAYNTDQAVNDVVLQRGDDLPPLYPDNDEDSFFGNIRVNTGIKGIERIVQPLSSHALTIEETAHQAKKEPNQEVRSETNKLVSSCEFSLPKFNSSDKNKFIIDAFQTHKPNDGELKEITLSQPCNDLRDEQEPHLPHRIEDPQQGTNQNSSKMPQFSLSPPEVINRSNDVFLTRQLPVSKPTKMKKANRRPPPPVDL